MLSRSFNFLAISSERFLFPLSTSWKCPYETLISRAAQDFGLPVVFKTCFTLLLNSFVSMFKTVGYAKSFVTSFIVITLDHEAKDA